jgi:hypothetical protein
MVQIEKCKIVFLLHLFQHCILTLSETVFPPLLDLPEISIILDMFHECEKTLVLYDDYYFGPIFDHQIELVKLRPSYGPMAPSSSLNHWTENMINITRFEWLRGPLERGVHTKNQLPCEVHYLFLPRNYFPRWFKGKRRLKHLERLENLDFEKLFTDSSSAKSSIAFVHPPSDNTLLKFSEERDSLVELVYQNHIFQIYTESSFESKHWLKLGITQVSYFCPRCLTNSSEEPTLILSLCK